ncbi:MAG: methyltransferase, partial [Candidatus Omnitrophica bacterium]|nr:methyltransferase [Candidatus Omnitrophota bacterium]
MKNQSIEPFFDALRPCRESQELARFVRLQPQDSVLDVGCGSGYLSFYVKWKYPDCRKILGIDINPAVIEAANRRLASLQEQIHAPLSNILFRTCDARSDMTGVEPFDALISNPPFFAA